LVRGGHGTMRKTRAVWSSDAVTTVFMSGLTARSNTPLVCPCCTAWCGRAPGGGS